MSKVAPKSRPRNELEELIWEQHEDRAGRQTKRRSKRRTPEPDKLPSGSGLSGARKRKRDRDRVPAGYKSTPAGGFQRELAVALNAAWHTGGKLRSNRVDVTEPERLMAVSLRHLASVVDGGTARIDDLEALRRAYAAAFGCEDPRVETYIIAGLQLLTEAEALRSGPGYFERVLEEWRWPDVKAPDSPVDYVQMLCPDVLRLTEADARDLLEAQFGRGGGKGRKGEQTLASVVRGIVDRATRRDGLGPLPKRVTYS
jgi:hypothetical protein